MPIEYASLLASPLYLTLPCPCETTKPALAA
jgi:hypothetical protein